MGRRRVAHRTLLGVCCFGLVALGVAACAETGDRAAVPVSSSPALVATSEPAPSTTASPTTAPTTTVPPTTAPTTTVPTFRSSVKPIDDVLAARMAASWRPGCPVALAALAYVTASYIGFDGVAHDGELVVQRDWADAIVRVFATLFDARFPIERMQLVDDYGADDQASMRANNTSAFNCREVAGRPGVWSQHSYGTAIDVNPLVNPWVRGNVTDPPEGAPYADRTKPIVGGIMPGDVVVRAFANIGWAWGGDWSGGADLQHFSANGN